MALNDKIWLHVLLSALLITCPLATVTAWAQDDEEAAGGEAPDGEEAAGGAVDEEEAADEVTDDDADEHADDEASSDDEDEEEDEGARLMGDALGLSILGVASVVGGLVFLVESGSSQDLADDAFAEGDFLRQSELEDRSDRESALGITLTSLGIVLMGVATWFWIEYNQYEPPADDSDAEPADEGPIAFEVMPTVDPEGGLGFVFGGRF